VARDRSVTDPQVVILGCGYTGRRVAERLRARGTPVVATTRRPEKLAELARLGARVIRLDVLEPATLDALRDAVADGARVVHSIPIVEDAQGLVDPTPQLLAALGAKPSRLVYISTTAVYGPALEVDENTAPAPSREPSQLRIAAEQALASAGCPSLVVRSVAIYGPGRGVHESIRLGRFRLVGDGQNHVSRIHVDDLAAVVLAALDSEQTGAFPVADEEPCTSGDIARFCAAQLDLPPPSAAGDIEAHHTLRANRRVNGRAILKLLGVRLRYPSYRTGVPAAIKAAKPGAKR